MAIETGIIHNVLFQVLKRQIIPVKNISQENSENAKNTVNQRMRSLCLQWSLCFLATILIFAAIFSLAYAGILDASERQAMLEQGKLYRQAERIRLRNSAQDAHMVFRQHLVKLLERFANSTQKQLELQRFRLQLSNNLDDIGGIRFA